MTSVKAPVLEAAIPILSVSDLAASVEYYQRVLGFHIQWKWGEPPRLASVCRDRVELNLSLRESTVRPDVSKVYFEMSSVDAYYGQITEAGAEVTIALADRPYGMKDFRIVDPDGNELSFGETAAREAKSPSKRYQGGSHANP